MLKAKWDCYYYYYYLYRFLGGCDGFYSALPRSPPPPPLLFRSTHAVVCTKRAAHSPDVGKWLTHVPVCGGSVVVGEMIGTHVLLLRWRSWKPECGAWCCGIIIIIILISPAVSMLQIKVDVKRSSISTIFTLMVSP